MELTAVLATVGAVVTILFFAVGAVTIFELSRIGLKCVRNTAEGKTISQLLSGHYR